MNINKTIIYKEMSGIEHQLNIFEYEKQVFFRANDIGKILELLNVSKAIGNIKESEKKQLPFKVNGNILLSIYLTELGVYDLLGSSRKEKSFELMRWINNYCKEYLIKINTKIIYPYYFVIWNCNTKTNKRFVIKATKKHYDYSGDSLFQDYPKGNMSYFAEFNNPKYTKQEFNEYLKIILKEFKYKKKVYEINPEHAKIIYVIPIILESIASKDTIFLKDKKNIIKDFYEMIINYRFKKNEEDKRDKGDKGDKGDKEDKGDKGDI